LFLKKEDDMKRTFLLAAVLLMVAGVAPAQVTTQKFVAGWDNFGEPLNFAKSSVKWSVSATRKLTVTYTLVGTTRSKLFQVALNFFCSTFPATFGQFPTDLGGGTCFSLTAQGVTATVAEVVVGVVTTDRHDNGSFTVVIGPIASGTYELEFYVRDGAGCDLIGGAGNGSDCAADFQSPGSFGTATTIVVP
jgi:hypothetical protein